MSQTIVLKNQKGENVTLNSDQLEDQIVLTRKRLKPLQDEHRVVIRTINSERIKAIQEIKLDENDEELKTYLDILNRIVAKLINSVS